MDWALPVDPGTGVLTPFSPAQIIAMGVKRRGMREQDHVRYSFGPDGSSCARRFSCAWDQRFNALVYFVGAVVSYNDIDTGVRKLSRLLPLVDAQFPAWICTKVEFDPYQYAGAIETGSNGSEPYPEYARANFTATFELVPYSIATDDAVADFPTREQIRYVTLPGYPGAEASSDASYIGLPGGILNYATPTGAGVPAGKPIPYPVGFVEPEKKLKVIWRRLPQNVWGPGTALFNLLIGTETARGYLGAVNLTPFQGYTALSLQLLGIEERLLPDATGLGYSWDLGYVMSQKICPYGKLGFYYHDIVDVPMGNPGTASGYYQVLRPAAGRTTITDPATISDTASLFHVREFANLFFPGVPW